MRRAILVVAMKRGKRNGFPLGTRGWFILGLAVVLTAWLLPHMLTAHTIITER